MAGGRLLRFVTDVDSGKEPSAQAGEPADQHDRIRGVLDALPAAVYATDAAGRVTYCNQAAIELAGRRPELGTDEWCVTWRLYWPDGRPMPHAECPMAVALKEDRAVRGEEAILERPDGTRVPFAPYPTPIHDEAGRLVGAVNMLVDISERRADESARAHLAAIVESSDDGIVSKDLQGVVKSWNRGAERIFGYAAEEMIGRPIAMIIPPDRLGEEEEILARLRRGECVDHFETVRRRKDGQLIDVSLTISPVRDRSGRIVGASKIARDISDRKHDEAALRDLNENLERHVAERTRELAAANARLLAEAAEREHAEAALRQSQKMEAVGQLASGIAHDFNNLLAVILGNLELLDMRLSDEQLRRLVDAAGRAARRGAKLNEQMLAFSRRQALAPRAVDLNRLIAGIQEILAHTLGGNMQVATAPAPDLWPALIDPHQVELVILNLAINARDAMPEGGRVAIATHNVPAMAVDPSLALPPGDYVLLIVADTGVGMSEEVLARACEPFFTTKEVGKGSGLGLAQAYGVAQQSGGGLRIKSAIGKGTSVEIYLPRSLARPETSRAPADVRSLPAAERSAMILVVDDEDDVREVTAAQLEALGHRVAQARNGNAALRLLHDGHGGVDLLLADYAMPGMSGLELARAALARQPGLAVIIVTGYADAHSLEGMVAGTTLLKKPYSVSELAGSIEFSLREVERRQSAKVVALRRDAVPRSRL